MGQIASVSLLDGQNTPATVVFSPLPTKDGIVTFVDRTGGITAGMTALKVGYSDASVQRPTVKTRYSVEYPVLGTVDGTLKVVRTLRANVEFVWPDESTDAERKNLYAFTYNGLNHALLKPALRDHDPLY